MKSKKIVALALAAAMALSISMTAFADDPATWANYTSQYETGTSSDKNVINAYGFWYKANGKDAKFYSFWDGSDKSETTTDGNKTTTYTLSTADQAKATNEAKATFGDIKSNLEAPSTTKQTYILAGWTTTDNTSAKGGAADPAADQAAAEALAGFQKDNSELDLNGTKGNASGSAIVFYPVYRNKTDDEAKADKEAVKNMKVVAVDAAGTEYNEDATFTNTSDKKTTQAAIEKDVKAIGADKNKCWVYDVKPKADGKEVTLQNGFEITVKIPNETGKTNIKDIKVFHISADGVSHEVTGTKLTKTTVDNDTIEFKYGNFSDFVVTTDSNAKATGGTESATSTEATATSTSTGTSTGTEDTAADGGNVPTGEFSALPVALLAVAALSATGVVAYKKRIAE